ncbi:hypothetical protein EUTSA_v10017968mg [Eutrema salsugineum]|uniref:BAHD acyltransferase n=1 Tax=Eutrema salsugineum TaxID=72664 RepID=V4MFS6_EUTSA|nr:BAHD acyltransferase At3g29680 [Eutrema salsugineum]ESQ51398.1 hypothetical protein EUTSA_v10017968mg [Eutrema salsugineum]
MALNVIKISRVSPATNSVEPLIIPLTFFDLMWLKRNPTERLTFYRLTESSRDCFYSLILPKLERSLSLALTHFLPLSGHLRWYPQDPKPHIIVLPGDTISLTVAETSADFSFISGKGLRHETELSPMVPKLPVSSDFASVFSVQITLFPNQGFCIGTTVHHAVMDGQTGAKFHKSWAHICNHGTIPQDFHLPMLLDRSVINVPAGLELKMLELMSCLAEDKDSARTLKLSPFKDIDDDVVRITLGLSQENIEKLKEHAKNEASGSDLHLSTFVVTYAYVLTCMVKTRRGDADRPVRFRYVADFRNRLDPVVPETYFGNCVLSIVLKEYKAKTFLGEDGFVNGVKILSDSVKSCGSREVESIWEQYEEGQKNMKSGTQVLSITGSNQFGVYGSDFGWGRPVNTEVMSIYRNNQFSMSKRRDEPCGVEIGISLKKCEMDVFLSLFTNGLHN